MAPSTVSCCNIQQKYDVFISFRGEDTRGGFTSHLLAALERKRIKVFIDYELYKGGEISGNLEKAIEESKVSLVVFSKDYASSKWCLNELVKIMDCKKSYRQQIVIPIFYQIIPREVRKQLGSFADAFSEHERTQKDRVQGWRAALKEASDLAGWDSSDIKPESVLVDVIVKDVLKKLNYDSIPYMEDLVGIESPIDEIKTLLNTDEPSDVCSVGIWGMPGIGKTTIADVVFKQISTQFDGCCFLEKVKDKLKHNGLLALREKLLSKLLSDESIYLETSRTQYSYINRRLGETKVLIVFDDVDDVDLSEFKILVEAVAFGPGSRIIITSRDRQVLINCGVLEDKIYQARELIGHEALELFSRKAFKGNHPPPDFLMLSNAMVKYAQGLPLALIVLGSALLNKPSRYWKDTLNKLQQVPNPKIDDVLRTSFDGLDAEQKSIFLDIACFFNWDDDADMDHIVEILSPSYASAYAGIEELKDKSLISLSYDNRIWMHDLLKEMGRKVVRDASKLPNSSISQPGKLSRLWTPEEVYDVLTNNSGTEHIESIFLDTSKVEMIRLSLTVFSRMPNLRLLKVFSSAVEKEPKLHVPEQGLESLPSKLTYLHWEGCPLRSLPYNFNPKKLVELSMPHSNIRELWVGSVDLVNLKKINLSYSKISGNIKISSGARWLRELNLSETPIQELPVSIGCLDKLVKLLLNDCKLLNNLPSSLCKLDSLEYLNLDRCPSFSQFPETPENLKILYLNQTAIAEVPSSIGRLSKLEYLFMSGCKSLKTLSSSICKMKSVKWLDFSFCSNLENFPEILEKMESLKELHLTGTALKSLPPSFGNLIDLTTLNLDLTPIEELPSSIENAVKLRTLLLKSARNLTKIPDSFRLTALETVCLSDCPALTAIVDNSEAISCLSLVRRLDLSSNNFERLPNLGQFHMLEELDIKYCKRLKSLPELPPHLQHLQARECTSLESVGNFQLHQNRLYSYRFDNCLNLIQASGEIIANAHRNIQLMAAGDVERFNHQDLKEEYEEYSSICFCLPTTTTEIPPWFNVSQSMASSVVVQLPPGGENSQFMGFELCVIVESPKYEYGFQVLDVNCHFKSNQGYRREFNYASNVHYVLLPEAAERNSDHLLLLYGGRMYGKLVEGDEGGFSGHNSLVEASFQFLTGRYQIKKCGVHLLYKDKEQAITVDEGQPSRTLSIDEEEDTQSKRFVGSGFSDADADANTGNTQAICKTESVANFGGGDEDQEEKKTFRKFSLWDIVVRFLHVCDLRNLCF